MRGLFCVCIVSVTLLGFRGEVSGTGRQGIADKSVANLISLVKRRHWVTTGRSSPAYVHEQKSRKEKFDINQSDSQLDIWILNNTLESFMRTLVRKPRLSSTTLWQH